MLPYTALGLILFFSMLAPGFVWLRVSETRTFRPQRSTVLEIAELAILGWAFTLVTGLVVVAAGQIWSPPFVNLSEWIAASDRTEYLVNGFWNVALSAVLIILLSLSIAGLTARAIHRVQPANRRPGREVAEHSRWRFWFPYKKNPASIRDTDKSTLYEKGKPVARNKIRNGSSKRYHLRRQPLPPAFWEVRGTQVVPIAPVDDENVPSAIVGPPLAKSPSPEQSSSEE